MASKKLPASREEKVAKRMSDLVNDYNLDIEEVGKYVARVSGLVSLNRLVEIVDVAVDERNEQDKRRRNDIF